MNDRPLLDYLDRVRTAGGVIDVPAPPHREPDRTGAELDDRSPRRALFLEAGTIVRERTTPRVRADHATLSVARRMPSRLEGRCVVEMGCGTGVLSILAARRGARVIATDLDLEAVALTRANAAENDVVVDARRGSLLEPVPEDLVIDLAIANLPHKPAVPGVHHGLPSAGGRDGIEVFLAAVRQLRSRQRTGGELLFFLHSLAAPDLLATVSNDYALRPLSWKIRWFEPDEFGAARAAFRERHARGRSYLVTDGPREGAVACVWHARRRAS